MIKITIIEIILDDDRLASGSGDSTIRIWNVTSGVSVKTLTGHSDWVYSLAVLPFNRLASGSGTDYTGEIKIWNMNDGTLIQTLLEHDGRVRAFAVLGILLIIIHDKRLDFNLIFNELQTLKYWQAAQGTKRYDFRLKLI